MNRIVLLLAMLIVSCGGASTDLFGAGSSGAGGASASSAVASSGRSDSSSSASGQGGAAPASASSVATAASSSSGGGLFWASGVQKAVPLSFLVGWTQCYTGPYGDDVTTVSSVMAACGGGKMLIGCGAVGSGVATVLAMGDAGDVVFDTLPGSGITHPSNGVEWYFDTSGGWGFLPGGAPWLGPGACDLTGTYLDPAGPGGADRMCWMMHPIHFQQGFRCGLKDTSTAPSILTEYERFVYRAP